MNSEDYPSDSDASDADFRPDKEDSNSESEVSSDDNFENSNENGDKHKGSKRKSCKVKKKSKKAKLDHVADDLKNDVKAENCTELGEEEEKQKSDALWADFLAGSSSSSSVKEESKHSSTTALAEPKKVDHESATVTRVFEFAGEAVEVTEKVPSSKLEVTNQAPTSPAAGTGINIPRQPFAKRTPGGGLGAVLNQIGKKNKLSTLEKSKLDWNSYKRNEGIEEELQTFNKGKDGYLERQDFLQRADLRQFEIEKSYRLSKSKR